jgi:opacity protein-like surface antigen
MARLKALTLASAAVLALASSAFAADLLPPPPNLEPLPPAPVADFSGWYLRGDIGMAVNASAIGLITTPDPIAAGGYADANEGYSGTSLSSSELADVGVGYQFNRWLRGDITVEYRDGGHFQSLYSLNIPSANTQYANFYRADVSSFIGLANVYADIGTWYGLTPYVGGGIGMSRNTLYGMTDTGQSYGPGFGGPSGGYFGNGSSSHFAWALMAGLDFNVTPNLKLELGYRYLDYGRIASGASNCLNGTGQGNGFSIAQCGGSNYTLASTNHLASNDFKLGLIWLLGEPQAPPPPEAPLIRKY